ncbi:hypothetical protein HO173_003159 [Letharia columbiana]|uniref:Uncharacterized protein n=1 Tax=Letharia columbiana TaxID=112416 RepID=A0A8H6G182_9LECA|nr:uncharacterized protein HO173_003159 [Letharia columbiana]KAF6238653.1 hypothetical protein HO173_003159 [Letharia columbiana]
MIISEFRQQNWLSGYTDDKRPALLRQILADHTEWGIQEDFNVDLADGYLTSGYSPPLSLSLPHSRVQVSISGFLSTLWTPTSKRMESKCCIYPNTCECTSSPLRPNDEKAHKAISSKEERGGGEEKAIKDIVGKLRGREVAM